MDLRNSLFDSNIKYVLILLQIYNVLVNRVPVSKKGKFLSTLYLDPTQLWF